MPSWLPSPQGLILLIKSAGFVVLAYYLSLRRFPSIRGMVAFMFLMTGGLGLYGGFVLAAREDGRLRHGRVVSGVVVEKYRPAGAGRTITTRGAEGPWAKSGGYLIAEPLARWIAYGSPQALMVDYRYPCSVGSGTCAERDRVPPDLWSRLNVGAPVNVRQSDDETGTARLDENPQMSVALAEMGIAAAFLAAAGLLTGRLKLFPSRPRWVTVPAVVTTVEDVQYRDEKRWKVRFAYFDDRGNAQESAAEVAQATWKPGDPCTVVYQPETPELATLSERRE